MQNIFRKKTAMFHLRGLGLYYEKIFEKIKIKKNFHKNRLLER